MRVITLAVLAALALAGCTFAAGTNAGVGTPKVLAAQGAVPADWVRESPVPTEVDDTDIGTMFEDRPDIVGAAPTMFESWSEVDDTTVAVHFVTGTPECYGAYTTLDETDDAVVITLHTGALPEAADRMCVLVAVFGSLDVHLSRPLGDRLVING
ncbi:hypothetical protein FFI94_007070 [Rhodococcus sp. KBS0724]|jgi:hypothetical protein|uniref:hypothetical protein n=1 Tax=Rhodococcus sp. KBS0724 TaxID=1179674 RepID=UPI00110DD3C1|nr:hypothetical protein [Rhodococcus sp. KBS0724]TSD45950.1 hypothetical protein FFI94_007070 [Rhodococcus sp. KBS0724]